MKPESLTILEHFPSNTGTDVVRVERMGKETLIKTALSDEAQEVVLAQIAHWQAVGTLPSAADLYPRLLQVGHRHYETVFYPNGTLDQAMTQGVDIGPLLTESFERLFAVALEGWCAVRAPCQLPMKPFLEHQWQLRVTRLLGSLDTPQGRDFRSHLPALNLDKMLETLNQEIFPKILARLPEIPLGINAHGDLSLHNIIVEDVLTARVRFIDTRGTCPWSVGLPWWDPVMDVATLIIFHTDIEPALSRCSWGYGCSRHKSGSLLPRRFFIDRLQEAPSFQQWANRDTSWSLRMKLTTLIRTLGSLSVQLLTAPRDSTPRAHAVYVLLENLIEDMIRKVEI